MKNRADIEVIAAILRSAKDNWEYQTTIMNNACISHSQVIRYIAVAMNRGLIEYSKISGLYKTTNMGLQFLEKHAKLLTLFPEIAEPSSQFPYN
ncbi:MAG: winged helix-turn-helix domain-containing protein [Nitrososphaeraceae archaeon]